MVPSSASQSFGVTVRCHSRGGAKQLYGVGQPSLTRRPTVTENGDAPETSPFRRLGYSKRWLDPRGVTAPHRELAKDSRPRASLRPGRTASAQLVVSSAGGPHRCTLASGSALSPEPGAGANPFGNGVRASAAARPHGVVPQGYKASQTRSPLSPQFGLQLPAPVRVSRVTSPCLSSRGGLGSCPRRASRRPGVVTHEARNFWASKATCLCHRW